MPTHSVGLTIKHEIPVGKTDLLVTVNAGGKPFGQLQISQGGIAWIPERKSKGEARTWEEFEEMMTPQPRSRSRT